MNVHVLERLVRSARKGEDLGESSLAYAESGVITPAEHRSLNTLARQISENLKSGNTEAREAFSIPDLAWI